MPNRQETFDFLIQQAEALNKLSAGIVDPASRQRLRDLAAECRMVAAQLKLLGPYDPARAKSED